MGPQKKKAGKKRKPTVPMPPFEFSPPSVYELGVKPYLFVKCKISCIALPHLNFEWPAVPTDLTLSAIKEAIVKRHGGSLPNITLYKGVVHPEHSLAHFSDAATLKDLGCEGVYMSGLDVVLPTVTFHYDFKAACFDDAIGAVEPCTLPSKYDLSLKLYRKLNSSSSQAQIHLQRHLVGAPAGPATPVPVGTGSRPAK